MSAKSSIDIIDFHIEIESTDLVTKLVNSEDTTFTDCALLFELFNKEVEAGNRDSISKTESMLKVDLQKLKEF